MMFLYNVQLWVCIEMPAHSIHFTPIHKPHMHYLSNSGILVILGSPTKRCFHQTRFIWESKFQLANLAQCLERWNAVPAKASSGHKGSLLNRAGNICRRHQSCGPLLLLVHGYWTWLLAFCLSAVRGTEIMSPGLVPGDAGSNPNQGAGYFKSHWQNKSINWKT